MARKKTEEKLEVTEGKTVDLSDAVDLLEEKVKVLTAENESLKKELEKAKKSSSKAAEGVVVDAGEEWKVVDRRVAAELVDAVRKRFVGERQICLVIEKEE